MITEKTKLILKLVGEQKITAEEAFILIAPDEPFVTFPNSPTITIPDYYPVNPWQGPYYQTTTHGKAFQWDRFTATCQAL